MGPGLRRGHPLEQAIMKRIALALFAALAATTASAPAAQGVGSRLPETVRLDAFQQTPASSYSDFVGRTVLIEFFAFW